MVVILFLLLLAAIAGVLGAVLKMVFFLVLTAMLTAAFLTAAGVYAFKRKLRQVSQVSRPAGHTRIDVGTPRPGYRREGGTLPPSRDDRY